VPPNPAAFQALWFSLGFQTSKSPFDRTIFGGEDDPIHPIESQADIAAALPPHLVQFERFAGCRHAVIPDAPERAFAVIRDFILRSK
jgi:pimeloyl-ACP methyl ester carboxylesterase